MKSKRLLDAIGGIDDKYIEEAKPNNNEESPTLKAKKPYRISRLVPLAASLVLILALSSFFMGKQLWNNGTTAPTNENSLYGLPVKDFRLDNVKEDAASMDRMLFNDFGSFFKMGIDAFALVRIDDTKTVKEDGSMFKRQISQATLLKGLYGDIKTESLNLSQSVIKDHFCLGTTNLVRKGGVYILPLERNDDFYYVYGDMDVLFEVDDAGKVWSHSPFEAFNKYDGKDVEFFITELQKLFTNEDFLLFNSPFSNVLNRWTLADITVTTVSDKTTDENGEYYTYSFTTNEVLSSPSVTYRVGEAGDIFVYLKSGDEINLNVGSRYLLFLDSSDSKLRANPRMIAEIGDDGTIRAIPAKDSSSYLSESVFTPYDGLKVTEIKELISRIRSYNVSDR